MVFVRLGMVKPSDYEAQLTEAIVHGKSDVALYLTCVYIHNQWCNELEDVFIHMCARIGEQATLPFVTTWTLVCERLFKLIQGDEYHIVDVLTMTTMLSLLHKRVAIQNVHENSRTMKRQQVKKEILEYFPEKARLSHRGTEVFDRIITKTPADLNAFVHRILAGFMRLFELKQVHEVYQSLVYISKRRVQLPLPHTWPAPDEETAKQGDPIWLLWGMMLLYFGTSDVATNWKLFCHNFKKKHKVQRLGLLYGISFGMDVATNPLLWTPQEEHVLWKIKEVAPTLWADFLEQNQSSPATADEPESPFDYFEPRGTQARHDRSDAHAYMLPALSPVKSIEVNQRSQGKSDLRPKLTKIKKVE